MSDALERYRIATEAGDVDGFMPLLADDAELVSPISGRMVFRVFEFAPDVRIVRIRPHFRPFLGLLAFSVVVGAKMAAHPGVVLRALRAR